MIVISFLAIIILSAMAVNEGILYGPAMWLVCAAIVGYAIFGPTRIRRRRR